MGTRARAAGIPVGGGQPIDGAVGTPTPPPLPGYTFTNAEAQAFVARMASPPSDTYKAAYDTLFGRLKAGRLNGSALLTAFDVFYVRAAPAQDAALLNLMGASYTATLSTTPPPFHAGYGFTSDGVQTYVEWGGWAPSAGVQYAQNSASLGFWARRPENVINATSVAIDSAPSVGTQGNSAALTPRSSASKLTSRINSATTTDYGSNTDGSGFYCAVRPDSATQRVFRNGVQFGSDAAVASTARSSTVVREGMANNATLTTAYVQNQLPFSWAGRALTANEIADLNDALGEYLTAVGWQALLTVPTGDANVRAAATSTLPAYTARVGLPDNPSGTFSGTNLATSGKGFTCTGLVRDPRDGTWWVSAFGRNIQGDASQTPEPRIVHLDTDRSTVLGVLNLVTAGTAASGLQGLAFDSSNNTLWFAMSSGYIGNINASNSASTINSSFTLGGANAIAYDSTRDKLLIGVTVMTYYNKDGTTTGLPIRSTVPAQYIDQATYAPDLDGFLVTGGPNAQDGILSLLRWGQNYGALRYSRLDILAGSTCVEGVVRQGGTLTVANDFWFHGSGSGALANSTVQYAAPY